MPASTVRPGALRRQSLARRVAAINFALVALVIALLLLVMNRFVHALIEQHVETGLVAQTQLLRQMIESADKDLRSRAQALSSAFQSGLREPALGSARIEVGGRSTPEFRAAGQVINLNTALADGFTESTGAVATVFARDGEDFVRVTTSLKTDTGARAMGTLLARDHPAYAGVRQGQTYVGLATLFGKRYMTSYSPLRDAGGQVIGIAFIGLDLTRAAANITGAVRSLKVGHNGYFYVLDARAGKSQGELLVHPTQQGQSLLDAKSPDGRSFVREMLDAKQGLVRYGWADGEPGRSAARDKIVAFETYEPWGWMIAGGAYVDEFVGELTRLRNVLLALGALAALLLGAGLYLVLQRVVTGPLVELGGLAQRLAAGDLSVRLEPRRADEVGALTQSMNQIGVELADVVRTVRSDADSLAAASAQVAHGNDDLAQRTERQAASLQQTSATMSALGGTVTENTQHAADASALARDASVVAQQGGAVVTQVVQTMHGIDASSRRIADIIGVIDGIAFQTNILALNAAVEAARAGESGRGFAVVAAEVRSLAGRAAAAAREIRGLIDASVAQVSQGSALVDQAGVTMQTVVDRIGQVCAVMERVSAATAQQSEGIAQAGAAVGGMDESTQQNAALVEEVAASTQALGRQAADLVRAVAVFKLPGQAVG